MGPVIGAAGIRGTDGSGSNVGSAGPPGNGVATGTLVGAIAGSTGAIVGSTGAIVDGTGAIVDWPTAGVCAAGTVVASGSGARTPVGRAVGSADRGTGLLAAADARGDVGGVTFHPATSAPPRRRPRTSVSATAIATDDVGSGGLAGRFGDVVGSSGSWVSSRSTTATASARLEAPRRAKTFAMCQFTVLSEIPSSPAISLLVRPAATRARISR